MATRRKKAKTTSNRGSVTQKRSTKVATAQKSKTPKPTAKAEQAARETSPAKKKTARAKAAAKSASRATVRSKAEVAAKRAAAASKSATRETAKRKVEAVGKSASEARLVKAAPAAVQIKENEALNAAKTKSDSKSPVATNVVAPAKPAVAAEPVHGAAVTLEQTRKASEPSQVVALQAAAKAAPRPANGEKTPSSVADEALVQKTVKPAAPRQGFKANEFVVYPAHGVGQIVAIEEQEVAGFRLELFVITFVKDKMMLRVPVGKAASVGMRKLSDPDLVKKSLDTLLGRARIKRTMWSRRAQEYEAKINSGDLIAIAEVVRDLYRSEAQPEQSYSERQLYEAALDRMAREVAVVQKLGESEALKAIEAQLQKGQRRGKVDPAPAGEGASDADVEEAA
jgi:CarD family transcriptional regulator